MTENATEAVSRRKIPHVGWFFAAAVVLGTVAICFVGILPFVRQVELIREIEACGGKVTVKPRGPTWVRSVTRYLSRHSAGAKSELGFLDTVEGIDLRLDAFESMLIPKLSLFPQMSDLQLSHSSLNDDDLFTIGRLISIRTLAIVHCNINGSGFGGLEPMPNLESVDFSFSPVRDVALTHLEQIPNLKSIYVYGCRYLTPEGLIKFAKRRPGVAIIGVPHVVRIWKEASFVNTEQEAELSALPNAGYTKEESR